MKPIKIYVVVSKLGGLKVSTFAKSEAQRMIENGSCKGGRIITLTEKKVTSDAPLIEFFNSDVGSMMGRDGDDHNLSPQETAVKWLQFLTQENINLKALIKHREEAESYNAPISPTGGPKWRRNIEKRLEALEEWIR